MIKIDYSLEVEQAIKNNEPVVALESTIITHGMPWPENLNTAKAVEAIVRENGATPATIAIINGCLLYTSPSPRDLSTSRMPSSA